MIYVLQVIALIYLVFLVVAAFIGFLNASIDVGFTPKPAFNTPLKLILFTYGISYRLSIFLSTPFKSRQPNHTKDGMFNQRLSNLETKHKYLHEDCDLVESSLRKRLDALEEPKRKKK